MKFRSMIFVMTIAFSVIFMSMIGTSYAYYVATDGTTVNVTTGNIDTGVAVVFEQSEYININTGVPISDSDVDMYAKSSSFILTPDASILNGADVAINIGITDFVVDNALVVNDFRYRFVCNNGISNVITVNGTGTNFTEEVINTEYLKLGTLSTTDGTFEANKTYTCTLKVWLHETNENQNTLMNKKFRGLIKVNTIFKK